MLNPASIQYLLRPTPQFETNAVGAAMAILAMAAYAVTSDVPEHLRQQPMYAEPVGTLHRAYLHLQQSAMKEVK